MVDYSESFFYLQFSDVASPTTPHPLDEEIPITKSQIPNNIKTQIAKIQKCFEYWILKICIYLEFGAWNLEFPCPKDKV